MNSVSPTCFRSQSPVSSNKDGRSIRYPPHQWVVYDTADPFWGQKLIDKIADKVRTALEDPEEAIFRPE